MKVKVGISLPGDLLEGLDRAARERCSSRSALLTEADRAYLEGERKHHEQKLQAARSIRNLAKEIGPWDGTSEILKWRSSLINAV